MDKNKEHVLNLIMGMWENDLIEQNGCESFEDWCDENIENQEQKELMNKVKGYVDAITDIFDEEI